MNEKPAPKGDCRRCGRPYDRVFRYNRINGWQNRCSVCQYERTRRWALAHPGLPSTRAVRPAYVDWVAVERAMGGQAVKLTAPERMSAVVRLTRQGVPARMIAARLRLHPDSVWNIRKRARRLGELEAAA